MLPTKGFGTANLSHQLRASCLNILFPPRRAPQSWSVERSRSRDKKFPKGEKFQDHVTRNSQKGQRIHVQKRGVGPRAGRSSICTRAFEIPIQIFTCAHFQDLCGKPFKVGDCARVLFIVCHREVGWHVEKRGGVGLGGEGGGHHVLEPEPSGVALRHAPRAPTWKRLAGEEGLSWMWWSGERALTHLCFVPPACPHSCVLSLLRTCSLLPTAPWPRRNIFPS